MHVQLDAAHEVRLGALHHRQQLRELQLELGDHPLGRVKVRARFRLKVRVRVRVMVRVRVRVRVRGKPNLGTWRPSCAP